MDQQLLRSLGIEGDLDVDSSTTKGGPGKSTLTSKLTPAPQVVFRVADPETARALGESLGSGSRPRIQREADSAAGARDGNGVMAGAEAAVDRAASSSGAPLPTHIQRQFEGSLGADLSGVRVHTGSESQEAAHAVGAKAYTVGNDIHFAAGRYQPEDPFGMHLLAHEVAHTVQQSGGAQRRQNKLEVSTPQDSAEHEADRAADAMVRGEAATVSGAGGMARQVVQREVLPPVDDTITPKAPPSKMAPGAPGFNPGVGDPDEYRKLYKPTNWLSLAGVAPVTLADPPSMSSYKPVFETILDPSHKAFYAVAASVVSTNNALIGPITDFKDAAAKAEQADAPSGAKLHDDPSEALENVRPSGSANAVKDTFSNETGGIKANKDKLNGKGLDAEGRKAIKEIRDKIGASSRKIATAQGKVTTAALSVGAKIDAVAAKAAMVTKALNESKIAELDAEKTSWASKQANFQSGIAIAKASVNVISSGAKAVASKGKEGVADTANAVIDLVEAGGNAYFTAEVNKIEGKKSALQVENAALSVLPAYAEFTQARVDVFAAIDALNDANEAYETEKTGRTQLFTDLSAAIDKALAANGATKADRDAVSSAVNAVPLMEATIAKLDSILAVATMPAYTAENGLGATHCTNLQPFLDMVGGIAGYKDAATTDRAIWNKRLASTRNAMRDIR